MPIATQTWPTSISGLPTTHATNPAIDLFKTYQSTTAAKAEFHQLLGENKRLHREIHSSDKPPVVAAVARKQGQIKKGEHPYVLHGLR